MQDPAAKLVALMQAPKISSIEYPETILYRGPEHRALQEQLFNKLAGQTGIPTDQAAPTVPVAQPTTPVPPVSVVPSQRGVRQGTAESVQDKILNKVMPRTI